MESGGEGGNQNVPAAAVADAVPPQTTDIKMQPFVPARDQDETGRMWRKWKAGLITRFRFFRIQNDKDKTDAISIYGGEHIRELIDTLPNEPAADEEEERDEFDEIIAKLDHYFTPMINPDSARCKFEQMSQQEESIAQYYVRLRLQAEKCAFPDADDAIRSKLLQTMKDGRLQREAMIKRYTLQQLLENAANKEDRDEASKGDGRNENSRPEP